MSYQLPALDESSAEKRVKFLKKAQKKRARKNNLPYIGVEALDEIKKSLPHHFYLKRGL